MTYPPPERDTALTFDQIEAAGLDGTLRTIGIPDHLLTLADDYRDMGYWFATGWWFAQPRHVFLSDRSQQFGNYCRARRLEYALEHVSFLPSIPDMWKEFNE